MTALSKNPGTTIIPVLRYRDAPAAIDWLCSVFSFVKHLVVLHEDGSVVHAQLSFGSGMVMLSSVSKPESTFGRLMTQTIYVLVTDVDAVYAKAQAVGAKIATAIRNEDYGGRGFSCYDLEGHLWSFGSYDPW